MYAFPSGHNPKTGTQEAGMSLRDYFAAKAMQGFLSNSHLSATTSMDRHEISVSAYALADAMMKERDL